MRFKEIGIISYFATCSAASAFSTYSVTDIGDLPGGADSSFADCINDDGIVSCTGTTAAGQQAFRWDGKNGITALPLLPGRTQSIGGEVDSQGDIEGVAYTTDTLADSKPLIWTPSNQIINIGLPTGWIWAINNGINDQGTVSGWGQTGSGRLAYLWSASTGFQIFQPLPGDSECGFCDINNDGVVNGWSGDYAVIMKNGVETRLNEPANAIFSFPNELTEDSRSCGYIGLADGSVIAGTWGPEGNFLQVNQLPGYSSMDCVNASREGGTVLAAAYDGGYQRVVLSSPIDGITDMNDLIDSSTPGWVLQLGININHWGQIVGTGKINGVTHAFLATPVVTPDTATVTQGTHTKGGLKSYEKNEGDTYRVTSGTTLNQASTPVSVVVESKSPVSTLSSYFLRVRSKAVQAGPFTQTLELFDWTTNAYSPVDTRTDALGTSQSSVELHATGSLSRYIGPGRTLRARYRVQPTAATTTACSVDTDTLEFVTRP